MKLKFSLFSGLFLAGFAFPLFHAPVQAEGLTCMQDYYSFILTVRSENSRSETAKDIFSLGYCQLNDIMSLDDELDSIKDNFRSAATACSSTASYKIEYQRILMEMYFVRHLQEGGVLDTVDEKVLEGLKEEKLASLKSTMKEVFVDEEKRVDEATFNSYYESWSSKYDDRIEDYRKCEEGAWADLTTTWTDFVETLKDLNFTVEVDDTKSFKEIVTPDTGGSAEDVTAMGNSLMNAWEYLKGEKEKRKAELENAKTVSEVGSTGGSISIDQALEALDESFQEYDLAERSADRMSEYSLLYGSGGSVQATNLQGTMSELNSLLQELTTKDLPSIADGAAQVSEKQCK